MIIIFAMKLLISMTLSVMPNLPVFSRKKDSGFPTSSTTAISIVSELYVKREDIIAGGALEATHVITTKAGELITTYLQIILEINLLMRQYIQMSNIRIIVL